MAEKQFTLEEISALTASRLIGDKNHLIGGVNSLETARENEASFLANRRYLEALKSSTAGVICIDTKTEPLPGKNFLQSDDPSKLFQMLIELFQTQENFSGFSGIHPTTVIHATATIGKDVTIGPYAVIDRDAMIGDSSTISSHVFIGAEVKIGKNCFIHPGVIVREKSILHDRVILQPGAVIGSCGFGYTPDKIGQFTKLAQVGCVILEEDVEIGANTTIDRAQLKETRISKGTKIDNLVQIAHNVEIGPHNAIAAQTGIAGSAKTGKHVLMGGQVGIVGHVTVAEYTQLATRSGVSKSLSSGQYRGSPAIPIADYNKQKVYIRKLDSYLKRIKELEQKLHQLEEKISQS